jgi:hypothetical protein
LGGGWELTNIEKETNRYKQQPKNKRKEDGTFETKNSSWPVERSECVRNKNVSCNYNTYVPFAQIVHVG